MLALLLFIPQWIFSLVLMYFIWITAPQIYSAYLAQNDYQFNAMLPVSKKEIAASKAITLFIIEGLHIVSMGIFAIVHNVLYGSFNFMIDLDLGFFGLCILMLGIFNIIFLPAYFKTAYHFGKPIVMGVVVTIVYAALLELGNIYIPFVHNIIESPEILVQITIFLISTITAVILSYFATVQAIRNYENIK